MNRRRFFNNGVLFFTELQKDATGIYELRINGASSYKHYFLTAAIATNGSTSSGAAPANSTAETSNATQRGLTFKSTGSKWVIAEASQDVFDIGDLPAADTITVNDLFPVLQRTKATGTWTPTANAVAGETIVIGGVTFTARASASSAVEFTIGTGATGSDTNLGITLFNLLAKLNGSADTTVDDVTYTDNHTSSNKNGTVMTFTHDKPGTEGNSFPTVVGTWAGVMSGATLTGGTEAMKAATKAQITA